MNAPLSRRAALAGLASLPALAVPAADLASTSSALLALIAAHREAMEAFNAAVDKLEAAEPAESVRVMGLAGCDHALVNGEDRIADWIEDQFKRYANVLQAVANLSPSVGAEALAVLEQDKAAALARLDEAFAAHNAAQRRWRETNDAEEAALLAVCEYRCGSPDEIALKFRYLSEYRDALTEEQREATFASLLSAAGA